MEDLYRDNIYFHAAELAHHFRAANVPAKAIDYSIRAGQAAASVGANAEAVMQWEAALALMEAHGLDAPRRRQQARIC